MRDVTGRYRVAMTELDAKLAELSEQGCGVASGFFWFWVTEKCFEPGAEQDAAAASILEVNDLPADKQGLLQKMLRESMMRELRVYTEGRWTVGRMASGEFLPDPGCGNAFVDLSGVGDGGVGRDARFDFVEHI